MINYKEYEKEVYDWLMQKHEQDEEFTFSLRMNGSQGAELDYFIGTEKSKYFATTFWTLPVSFPGSSGDCISLLFLYSGDFYGYNFEFNQTNSPHDAQNQSALNVLKHIKNTGFSDLEFSKVTSDENKIFSLKTGIRKNTYSSLDVMLSDIENDLKKIIPVVNNAIEIEKTKNPSFSAHRITVEEFYLMQEKLERRFEKYKDLKLNNSQSEQVKEQYSQWLKGNETSNKINSYIRAIDILNEILEKNLYLEKNIASLTLLYQDLIEHQKDPKGKYYYDAAPSYGNNGFYSASIKAFIEFLKEGHGIVSKNQSLFDLYHDYLIKTRAGKIKETTMETYVEKAKETIVERWLEAYSDRFNDTNMDLEYLKKIDSLLEYGFNGSLSFNSFYYGLFEDVEDHNDPLNQILYGPPGTGKTYKLQAEYFEKFTISKSQITKEQYLKKEVENLSWWQVAAIALVDKGPQKVSDLINHEVVKVKAQLSSSKKPQATLWTQLQLHTVENSEEVNVSNRSFPQVFDKNQDSIWSVSENLLIETYPEAIYLKNLFNSYEMESVESIKNYELVTFHQSFTYEDFVEGIKPVLDEEETDLRYEITSGVFKRLSNLARNNPSQPYAIFIDEINRGNVASIFGELITLIEKDKRAGAENELSVILPYSKQKFSVPSNLHIIGTMNTADRSIEALDSALRRRFEFIEMLPDYDVIDEVLNHQKFEGHKLSDILKTLNERITVLIDRDHQIGHSYFLKLKDSTDLEADLKAVFQNKIIPLLQEYFFNDYVKIAMVIGEGFMDKDRYSKVTFAQNDGDYDSDYNDLVKYEIKTHVDLKEAIAKLMGTSNA